MVICVLFFEWSDTCKLTSVTILLQLLWELCDIPIYILVKKEFPVISLFSLSLSSLTFFLLLSVNEREKQNILLFWCRIFSEIFFFWQGSSSVDKRTKKDFIQFHEVHNFTSSWFDTLNFYSFYQDHDDEPGDSWMVWWSAVWCLE